MAYFNLKEILTLGASYNHQETQWEVAYDEYFFDIMKIVNSKDIYLKEWETVFYNKDGTMWEGDIPIYVRVKVRYGDMWSEYFYFPVCLPLPNGIYGDSRNNEI